MIQAFRIAKRISHQAQQGFSPASTAAHLLRITTNA
jgi:hypothetical protein